VRRIVVAGLIFAGALATLFAYAMFEGVNHD